MIIFGKFLGCDFQLVGPDFRQFEVPISSNEPKNHYLWLIFAFCGSKTPMLTDFQRHF